MISAKGTDLEQILELSEVLKALSDPTRLKLIVLLQEHGRALCVKGLARKLEISQPAVSQHIRILKQARLIKGGRCGCFSHYSLNTECLEGHLDKLQHILGCKNNRDGSSTEHTE